jgi:NO-binding membrane sensor protein with MHYT domain
VTDAVQVVAVIISTALLVFVLDLVRRRKLTEEYSFIWILFAAGQMGLSIWRESLHTVARWLDVHYPPAVLLAALILFVLIASLYFSVVISRQREQIERLVEEQAIVAARLHDLVETRPAATGPQPS